MDDHNDRNSRISSPDEIQQMAASFKESRILLSALELDLFTILGREKLTSDEVAIILDTDTRATDRMLNALCALGLIRKENKRFSNTEVTARYLVKGEKDYMSGLMHTVHLWKSWSTMTDAVKKGGKVTDKSLKEEDPRWTTAFIEAMHYRAVKTSAEITARLDLAGVSRVLDVGGGSGAYAMGFVNARPDINVTVFDLPDVVPLARKYIEESGMGDRIEAIEGDYHIDEFGNGFDLVFLSAVIHSNSPEQNRSLIEKGAKALNQGGQIVIVDFIMDEDRCGPFFSAIFALNMIVNTKSGDTYTESEVRSWLMQAGFSDIRCMDGVGSTAIITGRKC
jgi:predicted O-methyltransferase YrrM